MKHEHYTAPIIVSNDHERTKEKIWNAERSG
jgi:hypothetical protein